MKTILLSTIAFILSLTSVAQNGGQASESNSLKIEQIGYGNGMAFIRITNKLTCSSSVEVKWGVTTQIDTIDGTMMDTILITIAIGDKIKAKPLTGCGNYDKGILELTIISPALPIKLISFNASGVGNNVLLQWIADEDQVDHYNVQESNDGINWSFAGKVAAGKRSYSFIDQTPSSYYRLASVDLDGSIQLSKVIKISVDRKPELAVYPNPVINTATIMLQSIQAGQISLYNLSGLKVRQIDTRGGDSLKIDLTGLTAGVYLLTDGISSIKITKQ